LIITLKFKVLSNMRHLILERLYEWSLAPYRKWFKTNIPWELSATTLFRYSSDTLGFHLGCFLIKYDFNPQPQLEDHDVFHTLTQSGVTVPEEIAMQFYLLGNGKRSIYLFLVISLGSLLFPDHYSRFSQAYAKGKKAHRFYHLNFLQLLDHPLQEIKTTFNIQNV